MFPWLPNVVQFGFDNTDFNLHAIDIIRPVYNIGCIVLVKLGGSSSRPWHVLHTLKIPTSEILGIYGTFSVKT